MSELTLASLLSHLRDELSTCEDAEDQGSLRLRAESVELDVSIAVVPGENGESKLAVAQSQAESASGGLHRARIRFKVGGGSGWDTVDPAGAGNTPPELPASRAALLPESIGPDQAGVVVDPDFNQADFDRMMDDIEGVSKKKKKKRKKL